jgi:hypothetical protein
LNIKESESTVNVNNNHHENGCQSYLSNVGSNSQHYILKNDRTVDYIQKMEAVINVATGLTEE